MSAESRRVEADAASAAFQAALTQIGAKTVADALVLWESVPTAGKASAAEAWLKAATTLILSRRRFSRELARAYYRLARALITGTTVADPYKPEPSNITLDVLRRQFAELAGANTPAQRQAGSTGPASPPPAAGDGAAPEAAAEAQDDADEDEANDRILVEELADLAAEEERQEALIEEEIRKDLEALGPKNLDNKLRDLDTTAPADQVDAARKVAHAQAGARAAAAASRITMNGGRSELWTLQERDPKALGYVRVSTSGTPCGWCAMLISRGPVYKSERSATLSENAAGYVDGDKYHDNCVCIAVPVFSADQYAKSGRFALNRKYAAEWPQVTRGLGGKSAVSAWRRFIREGQKPIAPEA